MYSFNDSISLAKRHSTMTEADAINSAPRLPFRERRNPSDGALGIAVVLALVGLVIHLLTNSRYGYFRDELYFLACGDHLAWGYVDFAPMIALIAKISRVMLGDSLQAIRFLPSLAGAIKILLTGMIAIELGAKRFGTMLACLCAVVAPISLAIDGMLTMNAFEPLFWMGCVYVLIRVIKRDDPRLLIWFGVLAGLGLENKHSMLFFGFAVVCGLLLTPNRKLFAGKYMWIAAALAVAIFLPNILWQQLHHWPTLEDLANVKRMHKNVELPPLQFLGAQLLILNPVTALVWLPGLFLLLFDGKARRFRSLGIAYLIFLALMMLLKGKDYYLAPIYPMLFAAGGVFWQQLLDARPRFHYLKWALPAVIIALGALVAPLVLPILPVEDFIRYQAAIGMQPPKTEVYHVGVLPQHFGDEFGWKEMVEAVSGVYHALPPAEQAKAVIYAGNYGEAGAIDFFGPKYGLPKAISAHQNYYFWGPRDSSGDVIILLQSDRAGAEENCASVTDGPALNPAYGMQEEHYTILICRGLKHSFTELWPKLKRWN